MWQMPLWNHHMLLVQWGAVIGASLAGAVCDARTRRIPNSVTVPVFMTGLLFAISRGGIAGFLDSLAGCLLMSAPFVALWIWGGGGAGDAKLMGAAGAWLGIANAAIAMPAVVMAGAACALIYALLKGRFLSVVAAFLAPLLGLPHAAGIVGEWKKAARAASSEPLMMPYGVPIFLGLLLTGLGVSLWRLA